MLDPPPLPVLWNTRLERIPTLMLPLLIFPARIVGRAMIFDQDDHFHVARRAKRRTRGCLSNSVAYPEQRHHDASEDQSTRSLMITAKAHGAPVSG